MLEKLFSPVLRFFGIIASSLTGITAVFTAVGFLAERSHLYMLGFTTIPVDLNQYMFTGARFFAYLPIILLNALGIGLTTAASKYILHFIVAAGVIILFLALLRIQAFRDFLRARVEGGRRFIGRHRSAFLLMLIGIQFAGIYKLVNAYTITNLLFLETTPALPAAALPLFASSEQIASWIADKSALHTGYLYQYLGALCAITIITGLILWQVVQTYRKAEITTPRYGTADLFKPQPAGEMTQKP